MKYIFRIFIMPLNYIVILQLRNRVLDSKSNIELSFCMYTAVFFLIPNVFTFL